MTKHLDDMVQEFLELKFGMFIHFNMETYTGVKTDIDGYSPPSSFDPGGPIDTDAWADAAVSAGMTYGVLTAKHCSGFCLWDSQYTEYDIMHPDCPYQQDLVAQFVKSFSSRGLKVGIYYSPRHPEHDNPKTGGHKMVAPEVDPDSHSLEEILVFEKKQITELIERFPEIFYIWNDGLDDDIMSIAEARQFFRGLPRPVLANNNWFDWGKKGQPYIDICTTEMKLPKEDNTLPMETCWMIEDKWFYTGDPGDKTAEALVEKMRIANSRNSNFLLNVGPDTHGNIVEESLDTLSTMGKLLKMQR